jgi:two-component system, NarL family, invasion response regulator UvrY
MENPMLQVLIADDHAVVRRGIKGIVSEEFDEVEFGEASTASQVLELVHTQRWDILILDITMPGRSGLEVLKEVKHGHPELPVLVLSIHPEDQFAIRTLRAGAAGYMTKENAPEELIKAIRKVVSGGRYVSSSLAEKLVVELAADTKKLPHESLSDREYQVLQMIVSGKTVGAIARDLSLSVKTISTHRTRILEKMRMKNNAELTYYMLSNRLLN